MRNIKIYSLCVTDSTNSFAKTLSDKEKNDALIIAERQTAGRGRMGRSFYSEKGGVYMSLLLHPECELSDAVCITSMAAVAVARAIEKHTQKKAYIKWVNDIYVDNKKVCGILCEGGGTLGGGLDYAVLGVGINLFKPKGGFPEDIKDIAGYLFENEQNGLKDKIINSFLNEFFLFYEEKKEYMPEYKNRSNILGKQISYTENGKEYKGIAQDITDNGNLVIKNENGICIKNSGEIKIVKNF